LSSGVAGCTVRAENSFALVGISGKGGGDANPKRDGSGAGGLLLEGYKIEIKFVRLAPFALMFVNEKSNQTLRRSFPPLSHQADNVLSRLRLWWTRLARLIPGFPQARKHHD
jgi:hypothetical protein